MANLNDKAVIDVILGEAASPEKYGVDKAYEDMLAIASVIANRVEQTRATPEEVAKSKDFHAQSPAPGMNAYRSLAEQAVKDVMERGPVHSGAFYSKSKTGSDIASGLVPETSTVAHNFFSDPLGREIHTTKGLIAPVNEQKEAEKEAAKDIQATLNAMGYDLAVDGIIGPQTQAAIADFESKTGVDITTASAYDAHKGWVASQMASKPHLEGNFGLSVKDGKVTANPYDVFAMAPAGIINTASAMQSFFSPQTQTQATTGTQPASTVEDPDLPERSYTVSNMNPILGPSNNISSMAASNAPANMQGLLGGLYQSLEGQFQEATGRSMPAINDAIAKSGTSRETDTPNSMHFSGRALDLSTRDLSDPEKAALIEQAIQTGWKGFGLGSTIAHLDDGRQRSWSYKNDEYAGIPIGKWNEALARGTVPDAARTMIDQTFTNVARPDIPTPTQRSQAIATDAYGDLAKSLSAANLSTLGPLTAPTTNIASPVVTSAPLGPVATNSQPATQSQNNSIFAAPSQIANALLSPVQSQTLAPVSNSQTISPTSFSTVADPVQGQTIGSPTGLYASPIAARNELSPISQHDVIGTQVSKAPAGQSSTFTPTETYRGFNDVAQRSLEAFNPQVSLASKSPTSAITAAPVSATTVATAPTVTAAPVSTPTQTAATTAPPSNAIDPATGLTATQSKSLDDYISTLGGKTESKDEKDSKSKSSIAPTVGRVAGGLLGSMVAGPIGGLLGATLGGKIGSGELGLGGLLGSMTEGSAGLGEVTSVATPSSGGYRSSASNVPGWTSYTSPLGITTTMVGDNIVGGPGLSPAAGGNAAGFK